MPRSFSGTQTRFILRDSRCIVAGCCRRRFANSPNAASGGLIFAFESRSNGQRQASSPLHRRSNCSQPAVLAVISTRLQKNSHFPSLFCDFYLRSAIPLVIVPFGPSFSAGKHGAVSSRPASIRIGVERKIRRISILDGSQATEQDQGCGTHGRESRHIEEKRRSLL